MCPTLQSHLLLRVMPPAGPFTPTAAVEPILELHRLGPLTGPPPADHRPSVSVALRGQLCRYTVRAVRRQLLDLASEARVLVLDLRDLEFLDASALRLFLELDRELAHHDGRLVLEHVRPFSRRILAICRLEQLLAHP